ncbi:ankyrin repeat domain-containing protein [Nocardioides glacieisoli]|uniref:Ankyrin repeat domain-containing protein n=1 Tax=Nocardioides glacieisoli TaxID=1168730 RepID=A0A4Q2RIM4_9ACTN|nr:ankyrin repeat domain-containing protein [Nocardioides glacieisoli]RYB88551.1 ankyrin repeat domain-containing protein [Nocardioides glacieisoli]
MSGGDWKDMFGAACRGDVDLVRFHVQAGVDVDYAHPEFQETALVAAILARHETVADLLLDSGADPTLVSIADQITPLEAARRSVLPAIEHRLRSLGAG